jgi:hypothetical protein
VKIEVDYYTLFQVYDEQMRVKWRHGKDRCKELKAARL